MSKKRPVIIEFIGGIAFLGALLSIVVVLFPSFSNQYKPLFVSQNFIGTFITLIFLLPTKRYFNKG